LGYSKNEIFELYASHAPFGGNVVVSKWLLGGIFGAIYQLSWAESATLAVLMRQFDLSRKNQIKLLSKNATDFVEIKKE
jgi:penicillin-binding protein 1C